MIKGQISADSKQTHANGSENFQKFIHPSIFYTCFIHAWLPGTHVRMKQV